MAKLKAPQDVSGFSFNGEAFEVKKSFVEVPDEAIADALIHGFTLEAEEVKPKTKAQEKAEAEAEAKAKEEAEAAELAALEAEEAAAKAAAAEAEGKK